MRADIRPQDDAEFSDVVSPLASNAPLRARIEKFALRLAALQEAPEYDDEATERHFEEVERLAGDLAWRDHTGALEQWDWAATFLSDETFRDLYEADRHWMFEDFIKDDVSEFLQGDWDEFASTRMSKRELANLLEVLSHFPMEDWNEVAARIQELLGR